MRRERGGRGRVSTRGRGGPARRAGLRAAPRAGRRRRQRQRDERRRAADLPRSRLRARRLARGARLPQGRGRELPPASDGDLASRRSRPLRRLARGDRADAARVGRRPAGPRARAGGAHLDPGRHAGREFPAREARARHRGARRLRLPDPRGLRDRGDPRILREPLAAAESAAARGDGARGDAARPRGRARARRARAGCEPEALREHLPARAGRHLGRGSLGGSRRARCAQVAGRDGPAPSLRGAPRSSCARRRAW